MAQEKKMAQEITKLNKAILKNVTLLYLSFSHTISGAIFSCAIILVPFFLVLCFSRPILNPFSTGTHFHAYSAYYLPILYNFRKSCGGLKKHRFRQLIFWSPQTLVNVNEIFSSHLKLVLEICLSIEGIETIMICSQGRREDEGATGSQDTKNQGTWKLLLSG